jgi:hypothetical protein
MKKIVFIFFVFILCCVNYKAQSNLQYISSTTGAACYSVVFNNGYLYVGAGNTLIAYDVSSGNPPYQQLSEHRLGSNIASLEIKGNKLFVAANHAGISMWDISIPSNPSFIDDYLPDSLNEAAYDMAFKGDSIFVAYKTKMAIFHDDGNVLSLLNRFAYQSNGSLTRGCDIKGNLLAFTTAYGPNTETGVHIYDIATLNELSFYEQDYCDPEDVMFGQNTSLLNVLGGTESWFNADPRGVFYSLDISNASLPTLNYLDTLPGITNFAIAQPIRGQIINDTVFVATNGAYDPANPIPLMGNVFVYDCSNASSEHLVTKLKAGLWHFDVAVNNQKMYVASEWYGVKTVDISDLFNEVDLGNSLTGGWNTSSDKYGNKLVVANEGYGFRLFDISDLHNPVLLDTNQYPGFCYGSQFSKNGDYIFGFYYAGDEFRVYNTSNLNLVSSLDVNTGALSITDWTDSQVWQDYAIAIEGSGLGKEIFIGNISNPFIPAIDTEFTALFTNDIFVNSNGKLFIANVNSLQVYDIASGTMPVNMGAFGQTFECIAYYNDTLYAYVTQGAQHFLKKYFYNGSNQLTLLNSAPVSFTVPKLMAADAFGLYIDFQQEGLFAYDKNTLTQTGYYRHGLEFYRPDQWGQKMLVCKDSLIILSEYFGQTTLFTNYDDYFIAVHEINSPENNKLIVYPNPGNRFTVSCSELADDMKFDLIVYDASGKVFKKIILKNSEKQIDASKWKKGMYLITTKIKGKIYSVKAEVN